MSLEKIKTKILEEAKEDAAKIIKEAEGRLRSAKEEAQKAANERYTKEIENEKVALTFEEDRYLLESKANIQAEVLRLKNQCIDEIFHLALENIGRLNEKEYLGMIAGYLSLNLSPDIDTLVIGQNDARIITSEWVRGLLKDLQKGIELKILTSKEINKGFILKGDKVEINCSLEQILLDKKEDLKPQIYRVLF